MLTHFVFLLRQWFRERASVLQCLCGFLLVRYGTAYRHVYWRWCARWMIHIQNSGKTELVRFLYSNSVIIICDRNIKNLFFFFFFYGVYLGSSRPEPGCGTEGKDEVYEGYFDTTGDTLYFRSEYRHLFFLPFFRRVRRIVKSDCEFRHARPSFRQAAWNNSASTRRVLMKFDIRPSFRKSVVKI